MLTEDGIDQAGKKAGMSFRLGQYRLRLWRGGYEYMSPDGGYVNAMQAPSFVQKYRSWDRYERREFWHDTRKCIGALCLLITAFVVLVTGLATAIHTLIHANDKPAVTVEAPKLVEDPAKHKGK